MRLRHEALTWHVADDEVIVLDLQGSVYLKLNGAARVLWERLTEPVAEEELADALVEQYGIDRDRATADVAGFVTELRDRRLIEE